MAVNSARFKEAIDPEYQELGLFSRTLREIEYLLLLLVILYVVIPNERIEDKPIAIMIVCIFGAITLCFQLFSRKNRLTYNLFASKAVLMMIFITLMCWYTGKGDSFLSDLYYIVIIYSALLLGGRTSIMLVLLISFCQVYLNLASHHFDIVALFHSKFVIRYFLNLYIFLTISYLTIMLARHSNDTRQEIKMLSEQDDLTKILNTRAFNIIFQKEKSQAVKAKKAFSIIMVDVDNLKPINDNYGHLYGDQMILTVADTLNQVFDDNGIVARYGGDEFIVLLPRIKEHEAWLAAEQFYQALEQQTLKIGHGKSLNISSSIGIATYLQHTNNADEVMDLADKALYVSKKHGKGCATIYDPAFAEITT